MKTIGEIVKIYKGSKAENVFNDKRPKALPYLQIEDLRPNSKKKYTDDSNGFVVNEKDILIAWDGANAGTVSFGLNGYIGSTLAALRLKDNDYNTAFIGRFLQSKSNFLRENCTGATIPHINRNALENLSLQIPKPDEQKRIAAILDKADRLRRQRRFAQTLSDSFLQSVFFKMFGDPVSNSMNWKQIIFGKEIKLKSGEFLNAVSMDEKGKYPVYGGNGINGYHSSYLFGERKIVIGRVGAYCGAVHHSKPFSWITDNALYIVRKSPELSDLFLVYLLQYLDLNQFSGQSGQPLISEGRLENINLIVPPLPLQEKFAEIVKNFERVRRQQREAARQAEHLFQTLLARAFRGEL